MATKTYTQRKAATDTGRKDNPTKIDFGDDGVELIRLGKLKTEAANLHADLYRDQPKRPPMTQFLGYLIRLGIDVERRKLIRAAGRAAAQLETQTPKGG